VAVLAADPGLNAAAVGRYKATVHWQHRATGGGNANLSHCGQQC